MEDVNALAFATELSKKFREACDTLRANGLDPTKDGVTLSYGAMLALCDSIEQLERERDAAVADLEKMGNARPYCGTCMYVDLTTEEEPCVNCHEGYFENHWQWRGVQNDG